MPRVTRSTRSKAKSTSADATDQPVSGVRRGRRAALSSSNEIQNPNENVERLNIVVPRENNETNWSGNDSSMSVGSNRPLYRSDLNTFPTHGAIMPASLQSSGSLASIIGTLNPSKIPKIVENIIPVFDGKGLSVKMIVEHCRAAVMMVNPSDLPCLTMLVRTKITGDARNHIQDRIGMSLEEILNTLEQVYSRREDVSELMQELGTIKRKSDETVPMYGGRVQQILNRLVSKILEGMPNEKGMGRCEAYKETAIGNFIRGLDRDTFLQLNGKSISSLDEAISLATEADIALNSWKRAHNIVEETVITASANSTEKSKNTNTSQKRIAHFNSNSDDNKNKKFKSNIQCHHCKKYGHVKKECRDLKKEQDKEGNKCFYCHKQNHRIVNCNLKKKHENERNQNLPKSENNSQKNGNGDNQKGGLTSQKREKSPSKESSFVLRTAETKN